MNTMVLDAPNRHGLAQSLAAAAVQMMADSHEIVRLQASLEAARQQQDANTAPRVESLQGDLEATVRHVHTLLAAEDEQRQRAAAAEERAVLAKAERDSLQVQLTTAQRIIADGEETIARLHDDLERLKSGKGLSQGPALADVERYNFLRHAVGKTLGAYTLTISIHDTMHGGCTNPTNAMALDSMIDTLCRETGFHRSAT